ncbi:hypothetical protein LJC07_07795, partial [Christensenellaceae bacterium OttesenSCG-928-L17]|nr:hypothetical protein [Christensenellaceae bacterium OttesenSCG-928-L17]
PHQQRLLVLFGAADCLSLHFRALRLRALRLLSGLGALLVLVFLLYDEMESNIMLPLYALLLIAAFVAYRVSKRNEYHEKYIQYRLLAEALRVQLYWEMAGVDARVWEQYTWAQQDDVAWVRGALKAMDIAPALERTPLFGALPLIQECWIENQLRYHRAARKKKQLRLQKNGRASFVLLLLSVLLFVLVFALEFIRNDVVLRVIPMEKLAQPLMMHEGQDITVRGALKIVLGIVSAGTALLSNYFSKLSLPVQARDNLRMANLYEMASERLSRLDLTADIQAANKILFHLGREAVVENGNWMLDYLEQAPDIVI